MRALAPQALLPQVFLPQALAPQHRQAAPPADNVIDITKRLSRWRAGALTAGALAASLAVGIGIREVGRPVDQPKKFVAVLQRDAASPAFLVSVDLDTREMVVRPVSAPAQADKSYELWIINPKLGDPKSLGVIGEEPFTKRAALTAYDRETVENSVYAVSVEPKGGSTNGKPSGSAVYLGRLIQATQ